MTPKTIYLIRHGETEYNRQHMVQGSGIDSDLNDTGREQARRFFLKFAGEGFQKVYTSGLKRTQQSVEKFLQLGLPHQSLPDLNEMCWGEKEGRVITDTDDEEYHQVLSQWGKGLTDVSFIEGESPNTVAARLRKGLDTILNAEAEDKVLVCMHGRAMRILLCLMLGLPLACMDAFDHRNLCLYKVRYTGRLFSLELSNYNL